MVLLPVRQKTSIPFKREIDNYGSLQPPRGPPTILPLYPETERIISRWARDHSLQSTMLPALVST